MRVQEIQTVTQHQRQNRKKCSAASHGRESSLPHELLTCSCVNWWVAFKAEYIQIRSAGYGTVHSGTGGPGSVVDIATDYGLDGPGIECRWSRDFPHLFRPALGPTQPPVQWIPIFSRG
jgi:hypothetical protein